MRGLAVVVHACGVLETCPQEGPAALLNVEVAREAAVICSKHVRARCVRTVFPGRTKPPSLKLVWSAVTALFFRTLGAPSERVVDPRDEFGGVAQCSYCSTTYALCSFRCSVRDGFFFQVWPICRACLHTTTSFCGMLSGRAFVNF